MTINWAIDWPTAIMTLVISPVILYVLFKAGRAIRLGVGYILEGLLWFSSRYVIRSLAAYFSIRQYCRNQLSDDATRLLQVPGVAGTTLDVDKIFVPLTLGSVNPSERTYTSGDILESANRIIVAGDPGSGKSSLVKRLFRDGCREAQAAPRKSRLPIKIELKSLNPLDGFTNDQIAGEWLFEELREQVGRVEGFEMGKLFDSCAKTTGLLVLLDGLDEVSSENYLVIAAGLRGLSRQLANIGSHNAIVVTMRIQFYQQIHQDLQDAYPQTLYIRSFLPNEIYTFLSQWPFEEQRNRNITRIFSDLTDRPTLREMCSNPLILAMYVANDQSSGLEEVPDTRTEFYNKVVEELLVLRRRRQRLTTIRSASLREQREAFLGELAFENLMDPNQAPNSLSWSKALHVGQRIWDCSPEESEDRLRELARETGIIAEEKSGETFRFIHLTFCEFLAAAESAKGRLDGWQELLQSHQTFIASEEPQLQSRLVEVIPFAYALLARLDRSQAMKDAAGLNDRLVLGRCFLETQAYQGESWSRYLVDEAQYLQSTSDRSNGEAWLRRLHLFNIVVRDAEAWTINVARKPAEYLDGIFEGIVSNNSTALIEVFSSYAAQDASAALRLSESVGVDMLTQHTEALIVNCQEQPFLALAIERASDVGGDNQSNWLRILSEAALRYENVARKLNTTPFPVTSASSGNMYRGIRGWPGIEPNSIYEACLSEALSSSSTSPSFKATRLLFSINSFPTIWRAGIFPTAITVAVGASLLTAVSAITAPEETWNQYLLTWLLSCLFVAGLLAPGFWFHKALIRRVIVNLPMRFSNVVLSNFTQMSMGFIIFGIAASTLSSKRELAALIYLLDQRQTTYRLSKDASTERSLYRFLLIYPARILVPQLGRKLMLKSPWIRPPFLYRR